MIETPTKTLEDVAKFLEEHDWVQGTSFDGGDGYCLSGAMEAVCGLNWPLFYKEEYNEYKGAYDEKEYTRLWNEFIQKSGGISPVNFNDNIASSKEDVIAVLRS